MKLVKIGNSALDAIHQLRCGRRIAKTPLEDLFWTAYFQGSNDWELDVQIMTYARLGLEFREPLKTFTLKVKKAA